MNIFALYPDPYLSARLQYDVHVNKMTLETAQLLCTAVWHNDSLLQAFQAKWGQMRDGVDHVDAGSHRLYRSISNPNHPSAVWVRESDANFVWTFLHFDGLIGEYHRRRQRVHACEIIRITMLPIVAKLAGVERVWTRDDNRNLHIDPAVLALADQHSPIPFCGPDDCRDVRGVHESYRVLYRSDKIFQERVSWTRCDSIPAFLGETTVPRILGRVADLAVQHEQRKAGLTPPKPPAPPSHPAFVPDSMKLPSFLRK